MEAHGGLKEETRRAEEEKGTEEVRMEAGSRCGCSSHEKQRLAQGQARKAPLRGTKGHWK